MVQFLEKVICERCGLDVDIRVEYIEAKEKKHRKNSNIRIQNEVHAIISQSSLGNHGQESEGMPPLPTEMHPAEIVRAKDVSEKNRNDSAGSTAVSHAARNKDLRGKDGGGSKGRKDAYGGFKRSDNPDVAYGRDFDDEPMPIEQIAGEIGEVVIRSEERRVGKECM